jgi:hypothetical protein
MTKSRGIYEAIAARDEEIVDLVLAGGTSADVARKVGLSKELVSYVLGKRGVDYQVLLAERPKRPKQERMIVRATSENGRVSTKVDGKASAEYGAYNAMRAKCYNPNNERYRPGYAICLRWLGSDGFQNFIEDVGPRPAGLTVTGRAAYRLHLTEGATVYSPTSVSWETGAAAFCKRGHPLSGDNLYLSEGKRHCKACKRLRRRYYKRLDPFHGNRSRANKKAHANNLATGQAERV